MIVKETIFKFDDEEDTDYHYEYRFEEKNVRILSNTSLLLMIKNTHWHDITSIKTETKVYGER